MIEFMSANPRVQLRIKATRFNYLKAAMIALDFNKPIPAVFNSLPDSTQLRIVRLAEGIDTEKDLLMRREEREGSHAINHHVQVRASEKLAAESQTAGYAAVIHVNPYKHVFNIDVGV